MLWDWLLSIEQRLASWLNRKLPPPEQRIHDERVEAARWN